MRPAKSLQIALPDQNGANVYIRPTGGGLDASLNLASSMLETAASGSIYLKGELSARLAAALVACRSMLLRCSQRKQCEV